MRVSVCELADSTCIQFHMWNVLLSVQDGGTDGGGQQKMGREPPLQPSLTPPHPWDHPHRLESISQLPSPVPTLCCCQFVSFSTNPSLLLLLWGELSRRNRDGEIWGHGVPPPPS